MFGKVVIASIAFLALISFNFGNPGSSDAGPVSGLYHRADSLYHLDNSTPATDSMAFAGFLQVIRMMEARPDLPDPGRLLIRAYLQKGVLLDVKNDYLGAKDAYCKALDLPRSTDSLLFVANVYAGTAYYNLNNFDSASYLLLRAQSLTGASPGSADDVRLYNTLGVLYYDNGNYELGKNYFNSALAIVQARKPVDTVSSVSLETNIATSYYRLGMFRESLSLYHQILNYRLGTNYIYMNMGRTYAALGDHREALVYFKKVDPARIPAVLNEMAAVYLQLHRTDSCALFLDRFLSGKTRPNPLDIGVNDLYRADLLEEQGQYPASLVSLQKAIILFSGNFREESIYSNPSRFTGTFAYYTLFDALYKKATVFERLYKARPEEKYLLAAYDAYEAALSMLRYIEKSYDTDDAKLFLKKRSGEIYQGALSVCLALHRLHPGAHHLEEAFQISERNKASIITAGLKEKTFSQLSGVPAALVQKEKNIKYNIARLDIKSDETQNGAELDALNKERTGYEIELARLQKDLEQNGVYYKHRYEDSFPGVPELQRRLGSGQALISFYTAAGALHIFILTRSSFGYARVDSLAALQKDVGDWLHALQTAESGKRFRGQAIGNRLYQRLIKPIQAAVPRQEEWIIVPDGLLYFLPFESLPSGEDSRTLLETTTISYRFSARMVMDAGKGDQDLPENYEVLAFAPFASQGGVFGRGDGGSSASSDRDMPPLPASREEIDGLTGTRYLDSAATKERFLAGLDKYPVIHLATHAVSSIDNSSASFIAFYPQKRSRTEDCLFLAELYNLNMNKTRLVIISACETGQGELVNNEGVISLARAFAYAGCESSICSLWRADDRSTSAILSRFHVYLEKGISRSKALQQAKLDYLKSDALNKSPGFWAHLILIGNTGPVCKPGTPFKWVLILIATCCVLLFGYRFLSAAMRRSKTGMAATF
jgi:CHAT domain-containing protein